jgi:dihydroflavonol-4-reductase
MGVAKQGAATEEEPYNHHPGRPYMETKHQAEEIAHASSGAMTLMSVRPSLVVGPGPFRRGMVAAFIERALHSGIPLAPSGGINIVDVEDVVAVLMEAMNEGRDGERFLATGHNLTTRNLMERICGLAEKPGPALTLPAWITGAASRVMDFWMGLGLPGELPALPMRMAGTQLYYDDSWTRSRLNLEAPKPLEHTLLRRIEWERNQR